MTCICVIYLFEVFTVLLSECTFVIEYELLFVFLALYPIQTRANEIGCHTTFRTCSEMIGIDPSNELQSK